MSEIVKKLGNKLLQQSFTDGEEPALLLANCQFIAQMYARVENSISVLSDLRANKSYIYNGGIAPELGLADRYTSGQINSIWEEAIFNRIHPDHLLQKHTSELRFFHLLKSIPPAERQDYHVTSSILMRNQSDQYVPVQHRMFYISGTKSGSIWLALCLYNLSHVHTAQGNYQCTIVNTRTGNTVQQDQQQFNDLLSAREKAVLRLIRNGSSSKAIAHALSISVYTVNRHRQNILEKLRAGNSIEAIRIAESAQLL